MQQNFIHIAIVEDDPEVRASLCALIKSTADFVFEGEYGTAEMFNTDIDSIHPDIILMDIHLPGKSGIETVKALKETRPDIQCMMFTVFEDEEKIYDALCAGATGYILKNTPSLKIIDAIRDLHAGGSPMSAIIARKVVQSFKPEPKKGAKIDILTTREVEILDYLSKGYRYKEIAGFLFISTETVRTHIRNIYQKLEVQSRTGALNKAYPKK